MDNVLRLLAYGILNLVHLQIKGYKLVDLYHGQSLI